jgi:hypothetical protein
MGFVIIELFIAGEEGGQRFQGLRCLNCGYIEDDVIRAHLTHRSPPEGPPVGKSGS